MNKNLNYLLNRLFRRFISTNNKWGGVDASAIRSNFQLPPSNFQYRKKCLISVVLLSLALIMYTTNIAVSPAFAAAPTKSNILIDKVVTSSGYRIFPAINAISGTPRWYCDTPGDKWIQVDLGCSYVINGWMVKHMEALGYPADYNTRNFRLQASINGTEWTDIDTVTDNTESITTRELTTPFTTRYIRLFIDQGNFDNNEWASIVRFEVYGSKVMISDQAPDVHDTISNNT